VRKRAENSGKQTLKLKKKYGKRNRKKYGNTPKSTRREPLQKTQKSLMSICPQ